MANNKVIYGNTPLIDLTADTVTADKVENGVSFIGSNGQIQTGTMQASGATVSGSTIIVAGSPYSAPSWSTGSNEDISKAIRLQHQGYISLSQFWNVGDEREIPLSDGNTIVLKLQIGINGGIFTLIPKYITYTDMLMGTTSGTYEENSTLRPWCNSTFYNYLPTYIKESLIPSYNGDKVYIPSSTEATTYVGIGRNQEGTALPYWTRTKPKYDRFYAINTSGNPQSWRGNEDRASVLPFMEI